MAKKKVVEHSPKFELVLKYYTEGLWSISKVHDAVVKGWITTDEYKEIVGENYEE